MDIDCFHEQELRATGKGHCRGTDTDSRTGKPNGASGGDTPSHCHEQVLSTLAVPAVQGPEAGEGFSAVTTPSAR